MCRGMIAYADEFLARVSEGVVHGVYKVVAQSSFSIIRQQKVSGGKRTTGHRVTTLHTNLRW